jgi:5-methylcytosine-specific restriction endonuclease McrA
MSIKYECNKCGRLYENEPKTWSISNGRLYENDQSTCFVCNNTKFNIIEHENFRRD